MFPINSLLITAEKDVSVKASVIAVARRVRFTTVKVLGVTSRTSVVQVIVTMLYITPKSTGKSLSIPSSPVSSFILSTSSPAFDRKTLSDPSRAPCV